MTDTETRPDTTGTESPFAGKSILDQVPPKYPMNKFRIDRYDPTLDSSPGHEKFREEGDEGKVVVICDKNKCFSGVGVAKPEGSKARFYMGMDARYKGMLVRAAATDTPVVRIDEGVRTEASALDRAEDMGWRDQVATQAAKHRERAEIRAQKMKESEEKKALMAQRKAEKQAAKKILKANAKGTTRTFNIGSNEFTGKVTEVDEENERVVVTYTKSDDTAGTRTLPFVTPEDTE